MPDLGLEVLLKGKNMIRILGGLWVALRISLLAVLISIPLGIVLGYSETSRKQDHQGDPAHLSGGHPYYAPAGSSVPVLF